MMKCKKRVLTLLLALCMLLSLAACGSKNAEDDTRQLSATVYVPEFLSLDLDILGKNYNLSGGCTDGTNVYLLAYVYPDYEAGEEGDSRTLLIRFPLDGGEPTEMKSFQSGSTEEDGTEVHRNFNSLRTGIDGSLWLEESTYSYVFDLPKDFDEETDSKYNYTTDAVRKEYQVQLDSTRPEITRIDTSDLQEKAGVEGTGTEENKGGIGVSGKGVRVFVPASQSGQPRGADLSAMKGQKVQLRVTEVNRARRRVVGSIRSVSDEARRAAQEEIWANIEVGKRYTGTVKSMTSYGVFVDIGGVDGMVHISELSWSRIKTPSEVCKVGDTMEVYVISFDPEKRKISLGVKDHNVDPWQVFMDKYAVGDVASVRVVKLMTFGAFAEVVPGVDGLIHISQIADHRIEKPGDVLSEGQVVDAKITAVDEEKQKISLSIRALLAPTPAPAGEDEE